MALQKIEVQRFSLTTSRPFDAVVASWKAGVGQLDLAAFANASKSQGTFAELEQVILTAFPRLAFKAEFKGCLCNVVRQKPTTAVDNILRDFGIRYVEGFTPPNFADLVAGAPFSE